MSRTRLLVLLSPIAALGLAVAALVLPSPGGEPPVSTGVSRTTDRGTVAADARSPQTPAPQVRKPEAPPRERILWRRSIAVGDPAGGRLVRGVRLPARGERFFTWDPVKRRSPNRAWRRFGTDRLVRLLLGVARGYAVAHPRAPRLGIGDLSRPRGGDFGPQFGYIGHASHQNGLDADVYYPRADGSERAPKDATQIDRRLSQWLVDRFVAEGAAVVLVGPATGLTGPPGRVQTLVNHDNHLHVRIR